MEEQLEYSIRLKHLKLENFRCFNKLEVEFDERLTVFIAENGGGKTSILDVIAECLKVYLSKLELIQYKQTAFKETDVQSGTSKSENDLTVDLTYPVRSDSLNEYDEIISQSDMNTDKDLKLSVYLDNDSDNSLKMSSLSVVASYKDFVKKKKNKQDNKTILPILVYYGGITVDTEHSPMMKPKNRLEYIYKNALSTSRINFTAFYTWFEDKYGFYLQQRTSDKKIYEITPDLSKIINAVEMVLNDDLLNKTYENLRIEYGGENKKMVLGKINDKKEYDPFEIKQLSAGEKSLFAFVADLGLRLLKANPSEANVSGEGDYQIKGKGIALIDEIDLHLHPKWQRKVIDKLLKIFPDIQFVITTHSPFVVGQPCVSQTVYSIEANRIIHEPYAGGHSSDYILSELMDTDPKNKDVEDYIFLIRQGLHESENGKKLKKVIDKLDPNSSDMVRINFALQRLKSKK